MIGTENKFRVVVNTEMNNNGTRHNSKRRWKITRGTN